MNPTIRDYIIGFLVGFAIVFLAIWFLGCGSVEVQRETRTGSTYSPGLQTITTETISVPAHRVSRTAASELLSRRETEYR